MARKPQDWTATFGELFPNSRTPEVPMYSYSRPSSLIWDGYANALWLAGWSRKRIREHMASKATRWMLDNNEDRLRALGAELAKGAL